MSLEKVYNIIMQTVYIETSIVSYMASKPSRDLLIAACQQATQTWWNDYRHHYNLYMSPEMCTPIELLEATKDEE
jgi:hypothetical protein